jgi:hypothetical protein
MASDSSSRGIGFIGALAILFIALKLFGVITWSWVWVLAPIWGSWALTVLLVIAIYVFGIKNVKAKSFKL